MLRTFRATLSLVLFSVPALATTFVVDASGGPGSQFTDIGAAILAAQPGDVILVRNGTYPAFVTSKGLAIIGEGSVIVNGQAAMVGIPLSERMALVRMSAQTVIVDSCDGRVLVQDVSASQQMRVISSPDVRCRSLNVSAPTGPPLSAFTVESSRVELVSSSVTGSSGIYASSTPEYGGGGIQSFSSGNLHVVASSITGGNGTHSQTFGVNSGSGGSAIYLLAFSRMRITGGSATGGYGGFCQATQCATDCTYDGAGGRGIVCDANSIDDYSSSTVVTGQPSYYGFHCAYITGFPFFGTNNLVAPDDPMLTTGGTPSSGQIVSFTLTGPPGATATMWLGRGLILQSTPPVAIEDLVPRNRVFNLGPIPPSGTVTRNFLIPSAMPVGSGFAAQAEVVLPGGEIRRTNSCPIVVR